ncbi:hypothetical protein ACH5RR_020253 [Cinchona calisaya]|uniref:Uncharacterized protein n=1 Tax=Cinchona calisaya TaxID=153742 RepID=A0ABD2ZDW0_9GENT
MADFPTRESDCNNMAHSNCPPGKTSWPELMRANGYAAALIIGRENPHVRVIVMDCGLPWTKDFFCDRVRIAVNKDGIVTQTPSVG